tara:strand:- start:65 stop:556 length:492 start_codon:yes stop_codon:yes gene_type:complete
MNKIYSLLASFFLLSVPVDNPLNENSNVFDHVSVVEETYNSKNGRIDTREELIEALIYIESSNNDSALNKKENALGCIQIRPIMLREVNRILKKSGSDERFKMKDRKNRNKSIRMFNIWADAYHKPSSFEKMARNWNGGPKGYKKSKTEKYWTKVTNYTKANL